MGREPLEFPAHPCPEKFFAASESVADASASVVRKRPVKLSIAHKSSFQLESDLDVGEAGEAAPENHRIGGWVVGASQIAAQFG